MADRTPAAANADNQSQEPRSPSPYRHGRNARRKQLHAQRFDLLRRGQRQLQNIPFFSMEHLSPWFIVSENSLFQQKLHGWEPVFNYRSIGRACLLISVAFVCLGACLLMFNLTATDFKINYGDECKGSRGVLKVLSKYCVFCNAGRNPVCTKVIVFPKNMRTPVYVYYELENFNQNHRQLIKSVDHDQLLGKIIVKPPGKRKAVAVKPDPSCHPFIQDIEGPYYFPCGAMANAMFTDDFSLQTKKRASIKLRTRGIAHSILKPYKFQNSPEVTAKNYRQKKIFKTNFVKPTGWSKDVWDTWWKYGGLENERFINWMVPSATSTLRKLYGIIDEVPGCPPGVFCKGNYTVKIDYRYNVDGFSGKKAIIFSNLSFFGSRNLSIAIFTIAMGCLQAWIGFYMLREAKNQSNRNDNSSNNRNSLNLTPLNPGEPQHVEAPAPRAQPKPIINKNDGQKASVPPPAALIGNGQDAVAKKNLKLQPAPAAASRRVMFEDNRTKEDKDVHTLYKNTKPMRSISESPSPSTGTSDAELDETDNDSVSSISSYASSTGD